MNIQIRPPNPGDVNYLLDIDLKCFEDNWSLAEWKHQLEICDGSLLVGAQSKMPIGLVMWNKDKITRIAVKPSYRHLGVGSKLLEAVERELRQQGCQHISIDVPESFCCPRKPMDISIWLLKRKFRAQTLMVLAATFCGVKEDAIRFVKLLSETTKHG